MCLCKLVPLGFLHLREKNEHLNSIYVSLTWCKMRKIAFERNVFLAINRSLVCLQRVDLHELSPLLISQDPAVDPAQAGFQFIGIGGRFPTATDNGAVLCINFQEALMTFAS